MKTVLEVIQATTAYFQKSGVENARLNIEHLLAHVLGKRRMDLYLEFDRPLAEQELEPLRALVKRRAQGEPLQHLLGTVEFLGRTFACDRRALVPRPETEQLVEMVLEEVRGQKTEDRPKRALDVGTGSGVIALSLAASWTDAEIVAVDISEDALSLARENAHRLGLKERVTFLQTDLLAGVTGEFQLIVANLPYIDSAAISALPREVRCEPLVALDGGVTGLECLLRLIAEAPRHLRGRLALEIGFDQTPQLSEALARHNYQDIRPVTDYQGRSRYLFASYG